MATRYPILDTQLTTPTTAGRALLTAADAAAQRTALGLSASYTAADFTATTGASGTTASIVSGRLRLSVDAAVRRYGTVSTVWTTTAPRGVLTLPTGLREVIAIAQVHSVTGTATSYKAITTTLRYGTDPSDVPDNTATTAGFRLPGTVHFDQALNIYGGEVRADTYPVAIGSTTGSNWSGAPTRYIGVRWTRGSVQPMSSDTSSIDDVMGLQPTPWLPDWGAPTQVVIALQQYSGGTLATASVDLNVLVWAYT